MESKNDDSFAELPENDILDAFAFYLENLRSIRSDQTLQSKSWDLLFQG
jgi:hypothetical protein